VDVLFIDEASQMSLANVLAISGCCRSLVLLGDPQQLAQPSQGSHPPGAEVSALGHIIGEAATMPPEHGLLLDTTWRLHPEICSYISNIAYDGRLVADASCEAQRVAEGPFASGSGLLHLPVPHAGNRAVSPEEIERVAAGCETLLGREWTDRLGHTRILMPEDILVVAPYNAQVARMAARVPDGVRVGTVDRFQGQEGAVVFFSLTTSSAEDLPHAMDFLFSLNRLNVAVSRARALAILVYSPSLLHLRCTTPEQMRLVNAFCRFVEQATEVEVS
jgi:superfamily I DNA and/or RNA helicase